MLYQPILVTFLDYFVPITLEFDEVQGRQLLQELNRLLQVYYGIFQKDLKKFIMIGAAIVENDTLSVKTKCEAFKLLDECFRRDKCD
jgi:hypothetical protein